MPTVQVEMVNRKVGADSATVGMVAGASAGSGSLSTAVREEHQVEVGVVQRRQVVEEKVVQGSPASQEDGGPEEEQRIVALTSPGLLSELMSGLSSSVEEEDEGDEEMDSDESLECGQWLVISMDETAQSSTKKRKGREEGAGGGGGRCVLS